MLFQFKINPDASRNEWIGWFGENVIKAKVKSSKEEMFTTFLDFLKKDLGIKDSSIKIIKQNPQKRLIELDLPDVSWELFLSIIEK